MTDVVNEKTTAYLTITFRDKTGTPAQPTSAHYRVDDADTGTEILDDTALSPTGGIVEVPLGKTIQTILDPDRPFERRRVTARAIYGTGDEIHAEFIYQVTNLKKDISS